MGPIEQAILIVGAAVAGFAAAWWLQRATIARERERIAELAVERNAASARIQEMQIAVTSLSADIAAARTELQQVPILIGERDAARDTLAAEQDSHYRLRTSYATLETEAAAKLQATEDKIELIQAAGQQLKTEFENLANRIFDEKQKAFKSASEESIGNLLNPVKQEIGDFRKRVDAIYDQDVRDRTSLKTEIESLQKASQRAGTQAESLARALTGDSRVRGNWGEISLERILEDSGLRKGHEYVVQESFQNEDGERLRPDVVVRLPEKKAVVIDSKVSLVAYERYHTAQSEDERQKCVAEHVASVRAHIKGLSAKNYQDAIGVDSLDLVLMFVPIEPAYLLALEHDATLYTDAFNRKILPVSPTTLMGTLQIIHNIWRYERQNKHALEIADKAGGLYDQFVLFCESLTGIGDSLAKAQAEYERARGRLVEGRGNLVGRAEGLRALGIKARKRLDAALLDEGDAGDSVAATAEPPALMEPEQDRPT